MSISRFGIECCRRALGNEPEPSAAPGYPLVLTGKEQERLHAEVEALLASGRITVRAPEGGEAAVLQRADSASGVSSKGSWRHEEAL